MSSYYFAKKREDEPTARETRDVVLKDKIMEVWKGEKGREVYGARKVWLELNREGVVVARCTVERLMRDLGISGVRGRQKKPRTTVPGDPADRPSDLLDRCFDAVAPNRRWVADITYVDTLRGLRQEPGRPASGPRARRLPGSTPAISRALQYVVGVVLSR